FGEYGSAGDELKGAAHGEALVAAMEGADAGGRVQDCNTEASPAGEFDFGEFAAELIFTVEPIGGGRCRAGEGGDDKGRRGGCEELPSCDSGRGHSVGSGYGGWLLIAP